MGWGFPIPEWEFIIPGMGIFILEWKCFILGIPIPGPAAEIFIPVSFMNGNFPCMHGNFSFTNGIFHSRISIPGPVAEIFIPVSFMNVNVSFMNGTFSFMNGKFSFTNGNVSFMNGIISFRDFHSGPRN